MCMLYPCVHVCEATSLQYDCSGILILYVKLCCNTACSLLYCTCMYIIYVRVNCRDPHIMLHNCYCMKINIDNR